MWQFNIIWVISFYFVSAEQVQNIKYNKKCGSDVIRSDDINQIMRTQTRTACANACAESSTCTAFNFITDATGNAGECQILGYMASDITCATVVISTGGSYFEQDTVIEITILLISLIYKFSNIRNYQVLILSEMHTRDYP